MYKQKKTKQKKYFWDGLWYSNRVYIFALALTTEKAQSPF